MLLDKLSIHLYRKDLGKDDQYTIVYPLVFMDDIYTDYQLSETISKYVYTISEKIKNIQNMISSGEAPVTSICGKDGVVRLSKEDISQLEDGTGNLGMVDNTSDNEKPVTDLYKILVMTEVNEKVLPLGNQLLEESAEFRYHVSGNGGLPIRTNPHKDDITKNILYNGKPIVLDPSKFISIQDVESAIRHHNDDPTSHPVILDLIKNGGEIDTQLKKLQQEADKIVQETYDQINSSILPAEIKKHNDDPTSHQPILDKIRNEYKRLETLSDESVENPNYEYQKRKVIQIISDKTYTNEYPSVLCAYNAIKSNSGDSIQFNDKSKFPYVIFNDTNINVGTTEGTDHTINIPHKTGSEDLEANMGVWTGYDPESLMEDPEFKRRMSIAIFPFTSLFCWRLPGFKIEKQKQVVFDDTLDPPRFVEKDVDVEVPLNWEKWKMNYGIVRRSTLATYVGYSENVLSEEKMGQLGYTLSGIHFSKYHVEVHNKKYGYDSEFYDDLTINDRLTLGDLLVSENQEKDPNTRVLWMDRLIPLDDYWTPQFPLYIKSFDLDSKAVQSNHIPIGIKTLGPLDGAITFDTENQRIVNRMDLTFNKMKNFMCGMTIEGLQLWSGGKLSPNTYTEIDVVSSNVPLNIDFAFTGNATGMGMHAIGFNFNA